MTRQPFIGVAGITSRAEADACLEVFPPCDRLLALGVLVSSKTLAGVPTRWHRRMPPVADIADLFPDHPRALNLVHYSSDVTPDRGVLSQLSAIAGPRCHGFQFNGAWPSPEDLRWALRVGWPTPSRIVLQARDWTISTLIARLRAYPGLVTDVLLDGSGGRGVALDIDRASYVHGRLLAADLGIGIGIAGGLCAAAIPSIADLLRQGASIDAEGRLRDDADCGGNLLLDEVRRYLGAAAVAATEAA